MLDLIISRHGQSIADIEDRMEGRADFSLSDLGKHQAQKLGYWLKEKIEFDFIISSPLKRASETAKIIGDICHKDISYDERLMERNNGLIAGLLKTEADKKYPLPEGGKKYFQILFEGESTIDFRSRVEEFTADLIERYSDNLNHNKILIVTHGRTINMLIQSLLNVPIKNNISIYSGDTGVHFLKINGEERSVLSLNCSDHLK